MRSVITAGGKGTRLYPITRAIPKELINFCSVPVIEYCINFLKDNGITDIIVVVGTNKGGPITNYLGNGELFGVNIVYVVQEQPYGLGDAIVKVEHYIGDDDFIVLLGDTILLGNGDLKTMIEEHQKNNAIATLLLEHITKNPERYGIVRLSDGNIDNRIISVIEKPVDKFVQEEYKVNYKGTYGWYSIAGLYILNNSIFNYIRKIAKDKNNEIQLTNAIELSLNSKDVVLGHVLKGKRIDIGSWSYITDERSFYMSLTDEDIKNIVKSREKMHV